MFHRIVTIGTVMLGIVVLTQAGQPGEKAKGPEFKTKDFTLVFGEMKTSSDVDLGDSTKTKHSIQLQGSMAPPVKLDVVAVEKRLLIHSLVDDQGAEIALKPHGAGSKSIHNAIIAQVGQVELPKTELPRGASWIGTMTVDAVIVIALKRERESVKLPAVVMEDFKDIGNGISVRIASLQMKPNRELAVAMDYKRADATTSSPFIEKIFALDPKGNELGGERWTEGDPFEKTGRWTAKFKLSGDQVHQSFRLAVVTQSEARTVSFEVKKIFRP
jgi:hypothetical protein